MIYRLNDFFLSKQNDKEHREHIHYALALISLIISYIIPPFCKNAYAERRHHP